MPLVKADGRTLLRGVGSAAVAVAVAIGLMAATMLVEQAVQAAAQLVRQAWRTAMRQPRIWAAAAVEPDMPIILKERTSILAALAAAAS